MNNQVLTSLIISLLYLIIKFIEMRFILKENKPYLKQLFIDSFIVFISCMISLILLDQFN